MRNRLTSVPLLIWLSIGAGLVELYLVFLVRPFLRLPSAGAMVLACFLLATYFIGRLRSMAGRSRSSLVAGEAASLAAFGVIEGMLIAWPGLLQEPSTGYVRWLARALLVVFLVLLFADRFQEDREPR
jgi:hypothetical protein